MELTVTDKPLLPSRADARSLHRSDSAAMPGWWPVRWRFSQATRVHSRRNDFPNCPGVDGKVAPLGLKPDQRSKDSGLCNDYSGSRRTRDCRAWFRLHVAGRSRDRDGREVRQTQRGNGSIRNDASPVHAQPAEGLRPLCSGSGRASTEGQPGFGFQELQSPPYVQVMIQLFGFN